MEDYNIIDLTIMVGSITFEWRGNRLILGISFIMEFLHRRIDTQVVVIEGTVTQDGLVEVAVHLADIK